jgi:hypothetical protein
MPRFSREIFKRTVHIPHAQEPHMPIMWGLDGLAVDLDTSSRSFCHLDRVSSGVAAVRSEETSLSFLSGSAE